MITYHADIAVIYQILTSVCPNAQNSVRLSMTLMVSTHPIAHGIIMNTSTATKILEKNNKTKTPVAKKS